MFFTDLETERLLLKVIGPEDAEMIVRQFSNDEVNRYLFDAEPITTVKEAEELIGFYMQREPRDQNRWILVKKDTGEKIGTCGFHRWDRARHMCELGYDLYPLYWKKGYMHEALSEILRFAQCEMDLEYIEAHIAQGNTASAKTSERQGFIDSKRTYMEVFRGREYPHSIYIKRFT